MCKNVENSPKYLCKKSAPDRSARRNVVGGGCRDHGGGVIAESIVSVIIIPPQQAVALATAPGGRVGHAVAVVAVDVQDEHADPRCEA